ncbi:hypothetical protein [Microbacterium sp. K36]|uniref:hypothetical protein n=1 Tax=Microbacterium sp. K36 TaxID=2305439 RepID=UPI00109C6218|nr:hypothetical protein [Microbacterium sp. K36]
MHQRKDPISGYETRYDERLERAKEAARNVGNDALLGVELGQLVDTIVERHAAGFVEPVWDSFAFKSHEYLDDSHPDAAPVLRITAEMRVLGAALALKGVSQGGHGTAASEWDESAVGEWWMDTHLELAGNVEDTAMLSTEIANFRDAWFKAIGQSTADSHAEIQAHRGAVRAAVSEILTPRLNRYRALHSVSQALAIPLNRVDGAHAVDIPMHPRTLTMSQIEVLARDEGSRHGLAESVADALIAQIAAFGNALERLPATANKLAGADEESVRDVLLFVLNANWAGQVTGETFIGAGKTDIHMTWNGREAFIGECKFWAGRSQFAKALSQLLDRYTVWRATRVALVLFIRDRVDISAAIAKAWTTITNHERFVAEVTSGSHELRAAHMAAQHDRAQLVHLTLVPVVIPGESEEIVA